MKWIRCVCRLLLEITFTFSGFVKGVDPYGTAYKLQDYFTAFGMEWLHGLALPLALLLSGAELYIGLLLLLDELRAIAVWGAFAFMVVFTPLTLYLAIANPVSDCGCFGDAIKLTNWETFGKNVVLMAAVVVLFVGSWKRGGHCTTCCKYMQCGLWLGLGVLAIAPGLIALRSLPIIDFRPYHIGASIPDGMVAPPGAPADKYATTFVYAKDGVEKQFTEADYPWDDSTWVYVSSETVLVEKGYTPPIHDFSLYAADGQDYAPELISRPGDLIMVVAPFITDVSGEDLDGLNQLYDTATRSGKLVVLATSSPAEQQAAYRDKGGRLPIYLGDERILKTVVRAHPGVVLIHQGVVLGKWTMHTLPSSEFFTGNLLDKQVSSMNASREKVWAWGFMLLVLVLWVGNGLRKCHSSRERGCSVKE